MIFFVIRSILLTLPLLVNYSLLIEGLIGYSSHLIALFSQILFARDDIVLADWLVLARDWVLCSEDYLVSNDGLDCLFVCLMFV